MPREPGPRLINYGARRFRLLPLPGTGGDDGRKRATTFPAGGHGLRGRQERAAALGGTCEAGTVNGAGWTVRVRIPLDGNRP
jgi:signal transduction histidine kinase